MKTETIEQQISQVIRVFESFGFKTKINDEGFISYNVGFEEGVPMQELIRRILAERLDLLQSMAEIKKENGESK